MALTWLNEFICFWDDNSEEIRAARVAATGFVCTPLENHIVVHGETLAVVWAASVSAVKRMLEQIGATKATRAESRTANLRGFMATVARE
jgi:hypothetical protein